MFRLAGPRIVCAALAIGGLLPASAALAGTLTVTDCGDTTPGAGPGQLRRLITDATAGDTIVIPPGCTITLTGTVGEDSNQGGDLDIAKNLTIQGAGQDHSIIDAARIDRVIHVRPGAVVTLSGVTIQNGASSQLGYPEGAGILNEGTLTATNVRITGNQTSLQGGGISNRGILTVMNSSVSANRASALNYGGWGGGIYNLGEMTLEGSTVSGNSGGCAPHCGGCCGGIANCGTLTVTNSTVSGNLAWSDSGGNTGGIGNAGTLSLRHSTVAANENRRGPFPTPAQASGISNGGTLSVLNTIIAQNIGGSNCDSFFATVGSGTFGSTTSLGHNLSNDASCGLTGPGDRVNVNPVLGPLDDNGGPTRTHTLGFRSPAIDAGDPAACPATDQRGIARPAGRCDIGAFELVSFFPGGLYLATGRIGSGPGQDIVTGAGAGGGPHVKVFGADGLPLGSGFFAYPVGFAGGVRMAACDVDSPADGQAEIVTGAGPGGGPHVRVIRVDPTGRPLGDLASFYAYDPRFTGGVFVACGDVNGDGVADIITGADAGGGPHVRVFRLQSGVPGGVVPIAEFFAFAPTFTGGVRVAAGNLDGSDRASIIAAAGPGGGPHVRAWKLTAGALQETASFYAYNPGFTGGVFVAAGNVVGDARAEIITGADAGGGPHVRVFTGTGQATGPEFFAYGTFPGGVRVATGDLVGAGIDQIVTGAGPGGGPHVKAWSATGLSTAPSLYAY